MKLAQRVNIILLPIIFGVFSLAGHLSYLALSQQSDKALLSRLTRELHLIGQDIDQARFATQASASNILSSAEMINFLNAKTPEYQAYAFEYRLYNLLKQAQKNVVTLDAIQILDDSEQLVISADHKDPFSEPQIATIPKESFDNYREQKAGQLGKHFSKIDFIFRDAEGNINYGLLYPFSPRQLLDSGMLPIDSKHFLLLALSRLQQFDTFSSHLKKSLGEQVALSFEPTRSESSDFSITHRETSSGDVHVAAQSPLYRLQIHVPHSVFTDQVAVLKQKIVQFVIALTLLSFLTLRFLIQHQILRPITSLITNIQRSRQQDDYSIQRLMSNNEVAELNNTYLDLLSDIQHLASFDSLTGLANRRNFHNLFSRQLNRIPYDNQKMALLYIDLDNFKRINDLFGHSTGDRVLQGFSEQMKNAIRPTDFFAPVGEYKLARLAGDEFALLLNDIPSSETAAQVAQRIIDLFQNGLIVDGSNYNVQVSIGVAMIPEDGTDLDLLFRHADAAMYQAKEQGKNSYHFFTQAIAERLQRKQRIEEILIEAIHNDGFSLVYMPIFDIKHSTVVGAEALLRCPRLAAERIGPDQFIPIAESTGLIKEIDLWVIEEAFRNLATFQCQYAFEGSLSINISAVELHNEEFPLQVEKLLKRYSIDPGKIEFEITETSLAVDDETSIETLQQLKNQGVSLALDDFGTGYTAFNQLAKYPVDCLKIDRSFVNELDSPQRSKQPMVHILFSLAQLYKLRVVAEGVETPEQLNDLRTMGCQYAQGYLLSKPITWKELTEKMSPKRIVGPRPPKARPPESQIDLLAENAYN